MARPFGSIVPTEKLVAGLNFDIDDAIKRYLSGEGLEPLAISYGISFGKLKHVFVRLKVPIRNRSKALIVRLAKVGRSGRMALTEAAHNAVRGRKRPSREMSRITKASALTKEITGKFIGSFERRLATMLKERGLDPIGQKAVGSYNIDIAIFPVAVEVHTATNHPLNVPKLRKRTEKLLKLGWWVLYVRPTKSRPLTDRAADKILAFFEKAKMNPSVRGEYRVIWGSGDNSSIEGAYADKRPVVSAAKRLANRRG